MDLGPPVLFDCSSRNARSGVLERPSVDGAGPPAALAVHHTHTSIGSDRQQLLDSVATFLSQLAILRWGPLVIGLAFYALYLLLRSRALWGALQAAYPHERIRWRDVWGAYIVGYAINNVLPLGGGNVAQLFLTRVSIASSSYTTVAVALSTGAVFDWFMGVLVMCFAFTQGVFPKPPDFSKLPAFDISFFASNMRFTLFFADACSVSHSWLRSRCFRRRSGRSGSGCARG